MRKSKLFILFVVLSISFYSCNNDDGLDAPIVDSTTMEEEEPAEEPMEDPAVTLANNRISAITLLTSDTEKIWKISSAELVNTNGTFDISTNFNVKDDEFIFRKSPLAAGKSFTDFEGSLEWKRNSAINLSADSQESASNELYVPSEEYNIDFGADSSAMLMNADNTIKFEIAADNSISGILELNGATVNIDLTEKLQSDYQSIPSIPLNFTSEFTFDSNSIARYAPDMVGSLANNSIYISTREDALMNNGFKPERILKYNLTTSILDEKLFFESGFISKSLIINNNKLMIAGSHKINSYDLDIVADPTSTQTYQEILGLETFYVSRNGAAVYNNSIYIIGGVLHDESLSDRIYKFDLATETMTEFAIMPERRSAARAEIVDDKLYIFGGNKRVFTPPAQNDIYIYDLNTGELIIETMPTGVNVTFASRSGNLIYVAGIIRTRDINNDTTDEDPYLAVYDTTKGTYTELESNLMSPSFETIHSMTTLGNKIYIIYGQEETTPEGQLQTWEVLVADL
ncbi:Kelch repeat-containing protein [Maribacter sp. 2308TA10-17]|uniref:Kelch repeat-containing protein n=1 Tax=Maribacter sp. 2308TA10-17 TaxID=3386276 RepID=UPI0039BC7AA4